MNGRKKADNLGKKNVTEKVRVRNVRGEYEALKQIFAMEKWTDGHLSSKVDVVKVTYSIICEVLGVQATYLHQIPEEQWPQSIEVNECTSYPNPNGYHPQAQHSQGSAAILPPLEVPKWLLNDAPATFSQDASLPPESEASLVCSEEVFYGQESDEEEECNSNQEDSNKDGMPLALSPSLHLPPLFQHPSYSSMNTLPPFAHLACVIPVNDAHDSSFLFPYNSGPWACCCPQPDFPHPVSMETTPLQHVSSLASPLRCFPYARPQ